MDDAGTLVSDLVAVSQGNSQGGTAVDRATRQIAWLMLFNLANEKVPEAVKAVAEILRAARHRKASTPVMEIVRSKRPRS